MKIAMKVPQAINEIAYTFMKNAGHYMNEKHRQLLIGDLSMRGVALYTMACRHLPVFYDKMWCLLVSKASLTLGA